MRVWGNGDESVRLFRIITAVADLDNAIECIREVLPRLDEVGEVSEERWVREKLRGMMGGDRVGMGWDGRGEYGT